MKFIFAVALLCIGVISAQTAAPQPNGHQVAVALEKRGTELLVRVKAILNDLMYSANWHLATALDHESLLLEALVVDLKATLAGPTEISLHHVHVIEEELLHMENSISEMVRFIEEVRASNHHGQGTTEMLAKAKALVKQASEALLLHPHSPEARHIEKELYLLEVLLARFDKNPKGRTLQELEQALALREKSLQAWLEKAAAHHGN